MAGAVPRRSGGAPEPSEARPTTADDRPSDRSGADRWRGTVQGLTARTRLGEACATQDAATSTRRLEALEKALARAALATHMQHLTADGPSWDECQDPICAEAKRLLPGLRLDGFPCTEPSVAEPPAKAAERPVTWYERRLLAKTGRA